MLFITRIPKTAKMGKTKHNNRWGEYFNLDLVLNLPRGATPGKICLDQSLAPSGIFKQTLTALGTSSSGKNTTS